MDQEEIRKLFKKYDVDFQGRKYLIKELVNKKVIKRTIRNFICHQGETVSTIYCLLKGSVQVFHMLARQMKQKIVEINEQEDGKYKSPRFRHQRIVFSTLQGEFQLINDQSLLGFLQMQERRDSKNGNKKFERKGNESKRFQSEKKFALRSRYSAIVTSSQCEYIELTFPEAKALLRERIQYITRKEQERQKVIQQSKGEFSLKIDYKEQQGRIQQGQNAKNVSNSGSPKVLDQKTIQKQSSNKVAFQKEKLQKNTYQTVFSHSGKRPKSISLINFNHTEKSLPKKEESLPLLNNFKNQLELFNQNQLILHRYRSKKAFEKLSPVPQSQNQKILYPIIKAEPIIKPTSESQNRLFKQNLKKIIRKKLNFQKKYGENIKQCEYITTRPPKLLNFEQLQSSNRTQMVKSYSIDKLKIIQIKTTNCLHGPKFNTFGLIEKKNQQQITKNKLNSELQSPLNEFLELQRMRKKLEQERLFLKLQNLDSYFDKME